MLNRLLLCGALCGALALASCGAPAFAQVGRSTDRSGTITTTNTFQQVMPSRNGRAGCNIQNNGANTMYVFSVTAPPQPTTGHSWQIGAGQTFNCASGNTVITDSIYITGTSGDAFAATEQ